MTVVDSLHEIAKWLNQTSCKKYEFKVPPNDPKTRIDDTYEYKKAHPYAFPLYIPTKDRVPTGIISNMPSVCVQLVQGEDDNVKLDRSLTINLGLSIWNPGIHAQDIYYPKGKEPDTPEKFNVGSDGWMDAWNFADDILRRIGSTSNIGNLEIDKSKKVSFGPYKEQEAIPDFYPFWYAWIQFSVRTDFLRNSDVEKFL